MTARKIIYFASRDFVRFAIPIEQIRNDPKNEKRHGRRNIDNIKRLLRTFGWRELVHVRQVGEGDYITPRGNGTMIAVRELAADAASDDPEVRARATLYPAEYLNEDFPIVVNGYDASTWERGIDYEIEVDWKLAPGVDFDDDEHTSAVWRVSHNRASELDVSWDPRALGSTFEAHEAVSWGQLGWSPDEARAIINAGAGDGPGPSSPPPNKLADTFVVPPFTVLDARQGYWRERKQAWLDSGLRSERGRSEGLFTSAQRSDPVGQKIVEVSQGTSIFDPVLAEILVRWFSPAGGRVLDPFAGGSVRGVVSAKLGRSYLGIDVREEQVEENRAQAEALGVTGAIWLAGDSLVELPRIDGEFDLILGCPPYYDLEVYSELDADISAAASYEDFLGTYQRIIEQAVRRLAPNSFAAWVVGDIRDDQGFVRDFVGDSIRAFEHAGMRLYNDAVLITAAGTIQMTCARTMQATRKMSRSHQRVLVFYRGDPRAIRERLGDLEAGPAPGDADDPAHPPVDLDSFAVVSHDGVDVLRDDLVEGGTKRRIIESLFDADADEVVYAGPAYGAAQLALALGAAATGRRCTLFLAKRKKKTDITERAIRAGARVEEVSPGYLVNVQAKARAYCEADAARQLIPFGFDTPEARRLMTELAEQVLRERGPYDQIWCVAGSGTLARSIIEAGERLGLDRVVYHVVAVGRAVDIEDLGLGDRVIVHRHDQKFEQAARQPPPYPSARCYDAKLWEHLVQHREGRVLAWNVMG